MGNLEELARKKFADLSTAEERVVRSAADGTEADCRRDLGGGSDPSQAGGTGEMPDGKWPGTRDVRADLIRWLCIDREAREQIDPRGIHIQGARIAEPFDLSFTNVPFPLVLVSCRFEQTLDLKSAKIPLLSLEGSWTGSIVADGLKLEGDIFLRDGFHAEGEVRLLGATIGGDLSARRGSFKNSKGDALTGDRVKVAGSVFIGEGFSAEGEVRFVNATIGGSLNAAKGTFKNPNLNALNAAGIEVRGSVSLSDKFVADGTVRLVGAEIRGQLEVVDVWLDALNLNSAHIAGPFFWREIHKDEMAHFPNKEWKPSLDLTNAKVGPLLDEELSWPEEGRLRLDGFVYDRIAEGPTKATARLRWLGLQPKEDRYLPQPYEQLIAVLRQMGHEDQIAEVAIAKQKDLHERGGLGRWGKFWSRFLYRTIRYGYEPWRAFLWMAILVIVGTVVFSLARLPSVAVMAPSDKEAYQDEKTEKATLPPYYPQFNAFMYSLDVILPFDLGQRSQWRLSENQSGALLYWIFEVYSLFQVFAGWVLLIVVAAVPAGLIKKD
jgi:hypothetical protein